MWGKWPFRTNCPQFWSVLTNFGRKKLVKTGFTQFFHFGRKKQVLDGKNPTLSLDLALPRVSSIELALYISSSIYPYICYFYIYLVLSSICIYFSILPSGSHSLDSFIYLYPSLDISFCQSMFLALSIDISLSLYLYRYLWLCIGLTLSITLSNSVNHSRYPSISFSIFRAKFLYISRASSSPLFISNSRYLFNIYLFLMLSISC